MIAEIISVGTELLMGQVLNTNAKYIAQKLSELGIRILYQSTVGDNMERLTQCIAVGAARSDIIILSGGLGPTQDDITKLSVAAYLGLPMVQDKAVLKWLEEQMIIRGRAMTPNNYRQTEFPKGAIILPNPNGTAPGCICESADVIIIVLPGPPNELEPMFDHHVFSYLQEKCNNRLYSRMIRVFGVGESAAEYMLKDIIEQQTNPSIAPYCGTCDVAFRITALTEIGNDPEALVSPVVEEFEKRLGENIYSLDGESMAEVVARLLKQTGKTLSIAESITGGMISSELVSCPGISQYLLEADVVYTVPAKIRLGVDAQLLKKSGTVNEEVALQMAQNIRVRAGSDIGLSTTGVAGPGSDEYNNPQGLAYIGISSALRTFAIKVQFPGSRARIRTLATINALNELRKVLLMQNK